MSNYTKSTNFATKDNLTPGDPLKVVRGTEIDTEYNNIATAIATKTDNASAAITGGSITGITDLAVADGGTGASTAAGALNNLLPTQTGNANKYLQTDGTNATWDAVTLSTADITGTLPVANGGTGVTSSTGTGSVVLSNSPTLVTPVLGTPASGTATNLTGLPISTGVSGLGTGVATFLGTPSSANLASAVSDETGSGALVFANSPTLVTPALGTPASGVLTNATGLPISTGVSGLGTGVATFLGTPSSANLASAVSDETGSGALVFANSPTLVTPALGTPSALVGTNITGTASGLTAGNVTTNANLTGAVTSVGNATSLGSFSSANLLSALTDETGTGSAVFATSPTLVTPVLGTPTSATLTNATGLPLTTGVTGTLPTANGGTNLTSFTANGVVYASSSSALATGSVFTFDGANVIINATTPAYFTGTSNLAQISINRSPSTGAIFNASQSAAFMNIDGASGGSSIQFATASAANTQPSERARIDASGNVGIGTSAPSAKLTVINASDANKQIVFSDNATYYGSIGHNSGTGANEYRTEAAPYGEHRFFIGTSGTANLTINSAGNVGIGTSSPAYKLDLLTSANFAGRWANATRAGHLYLDSGGPGIFNTAAYGGEGIYFHAGSNYTAFLTNSAERMRLDSAGNLLVGKTSGGGAVGPRVEIDNTNNTSGDNGLFVYLGGNCSNTSSNIFSGLISGVGNKFYVFGNGNVVNTNNSYGAISDVKFKENIVDATPKLNDVLNLKVRNFNLKTEPNNKQIGFIAQEFEEVFPAMIDVSPDTDVNGKNLETTHKSIKLSVLVPILVKAIQEQQALITALTARITALESN